MKSVTIQNVKNGENVPHKLLLLCGRISANQINLFVKNPPLTIACNGSSGAVDICRHSNEFRAIVQLERGKNEILFHEEDDVEVLTVFFEPSQRRQRLRVFLVIFNDMSDKFEEEAAKITLSSRLLQLFVAEELNRQFGERQTFCFEEENQKNICTVFRSKYVERDLISLTNEEVFWKIAKDLTDRFPNERGECKYLAFLSFTKFVNEDFSNCSLNPSWDESLKKTKFYVNYAVGDVAVVNGAGISSWPLDVNSILRRFCDLTQVPSTMLDDSGDRGTIGGVYATTLGMTMHEIGHVFDLVHTQNGIMSRDFDNIQLAFLGESAKKTCAQSRKSRLNRKTFGVNETSGEEEIFYHFHSSSLSILRYHKWLNDFDESVSSALDTFVVQGSRIRSKNGLAFIELRQNGESIHKWDLALYKPKLWLIPEDVRRLTLDLFVLDVKGCVKVVVLKK